MKICPTCGGLFDDPSWRCPEGHSVPQTVQGFRSFAPEHTARHEGFVGEYFEQLARLEAGHFWFSSRNQLIIWTISRYFPEARNFLEVGCGTGFVLAGIARAFPALALSGSEVYGTALAGASRRVPTAHLYQMDARKIPFLDEFDLVGMFDVLEHVGEDMDVLRQLHRAVRPSGGLIMTVPQHRFLWSRQDEHARHVRRYSLAELREKTLQAGFRIVRATSFVSLLLPLMMLSRSVGQRGGEDADVMAELKIRPAVNSVLKAVLGLERGLIRSGVNFPFGGSLILIARKT